MLALYGTVFYAIMYISNKRKEEHFMNTTYVKPENYIVIQGFMLTDLHLKGAELLVYATIYGFCQT